MRKKGYKNTIEVKNTKIRLCWVLFSRDSEKIRVFPLFLWIVHQKTCPSLFRFVVRLIAAGCPACASFAVGQRCTGGRVRVSVGVVG